jgi:AcrR family transcriptional regulator
MATRTSDATPADSPAGGRRGPRGRRGDVADRILDVARDSFASRGFDGTTMQRIARDAGVDTRLVSYYFTSKDALLVAALEPPEGFLEGIRAALDVPEGERGVTLVARVLAAWGEPRLARLLRSAILMAAQEPAAMDLLRAVFVRAILPAVSEALPDDERELRAALVSTQILGMAITRFVYEVDQVVAIPDTLLIAAVGGTVQRYLMDELPIRTDP